MSTHALLSPSSSARWSTCTGSVARIEALKAEGKIPPESTSRFADEGTQAHSYAAAALVMGWCDGVIPDRLLALHVKSYVDYVESHVTGDGQLHVEERVPLFYSPEDGGTVDAWVYHPAEHGKGHLHIFDYKHGEGIAVDAEQNTQLAIYAESLICSHPELRGISMDAQVTMHIRQPRVRQGDTTKTWSMTRRELQDFTDKLAEAAEAISSTTAVSIAPSEKACQFCEAKAFCKEHAAWKHGDMSPAYVEQAVMDATQLPDTGLLSDEQLIAVAKVHMDGGFASWMKRCADAVLDRLQRGQLSDCGLKVVKSNKHRTWVDEDKVVQLLGRKLGRGEILAPAKLITPSQVEKKLAAAKLEMSTRFKNRLEALIVKPEGGPVLALDTDPREAIKPIDAATEFDEDLL